MPPFATDLLAPQRQAITIELAPAPHMLSSLITLNMVDDFSGVSDWSIRTAAALPAARRHLNRLVLEGLYAAVIPERRWASFPAYLDGLAARNPIELRDQVLKVSSTKSGSRPDPAVVLASAEAYLAFLRENFPPESIHEAIEAEAYTLMCDPPRMRDLIVGHLRAMWEEVLAPEWERVLPMLQEAVQALRQLDLSGLEPQAAVKLITDREPSDAWDDALNNAQQVVFVPSMHIGPYMQQIRAGRLVWIMFGAHLPEGAASAASALSRSELLVRLAALDDDTRLRILALISGAGELFAQDVMTRLDLSQSATSRHLRQLTATGFLTERWSDGAKRYSLNRARLASTYRALNHFLDGEGAHDELG